MKKKVLKIEAQALVYMKRIPFSEQDFFSLFISGFGVFESGNFKFLKVE
jgi:hypothetical protein